MVMALLAPTSVSTPVVGTPTAAAQPKVPCPSSVSGAGAATSSTRAESVGAGAGCEQPARAAARSRAVRSKGRERGMRGTKPHPLPGDHKVVGGLVETPASTEVLSRVSRWTHRADGGDGPEGLGSGGVGGEGAQAARRGPQDDVPGRLGASGRLLLHGGVPRRPVQIGREHA